LHSSFESQESQNTSPALNNTSIIAIASQFLYNSQGRTGYLHKRLYFNIFYIISKGVQMRRIALLSLVILIGTVTSGCSIVAPQYSGSMENVQLLKDAGNVSAKVGKFDFIPGSGNYNSISLRAPSMHSPYEDSYAAYLAEAIKQELALAGKLKPDTDIEISGSLLKNSISISSFSVGTGDIQARFVIKKGEQVRYDQIKTIHTQWESSFIGNIAIPRAQQQYPGMVQKLLATLYEDKDFLAALK
jgi:hypothetical protein